MLINLTDLIHKMFIYSHAASFIRYPFIRYLGAHLLVVAFRRCVMSFMSSSRTVQFAWLKTQTKPTDLKETQ